MGQVWNKIKSNGSEMAEKLEEAAGDMVCDSCGRKNAHKRELRNGENEVKGYIYLCDKCFNEIK